MGCGNSSIESGRKCDVSSLVSSEGSEELLLKRLTDHLTEHFASSNSSDFIREQLDDYWNPIFSELRVKKKLQRYPLKKASGSDNISSRVYVELADFLSKPLSFIYQQSYKQKKFPTAWKVGHIVAIPKSYPPDADRLRYITLLPLPAKIFEQLIYEQLRERFESSYGQEQHGFRRNASTTTALLRIVNAAAKLYDERSNFGLLILSYDLSSAFDCVEHALILKRLYKLSFPRGFIHWLSSYLQDRSGVLKLITKSSYPIRIHRGVP